MKVKRSAIIMSAVIRLYKNDGIGNAFINFDTIIQNLIC